MKQVKESDEFESSSSSDSSSNASSSSSDEAEPAPAKKAKCHKPSVQLAQKAAKKGNNLSSAQAKAMKKQARKAESEKVPDFEEELQRIEKLIETWKKNGVEDHVVQRFVARLFRKLRILDFIPSVDHALFKREIGYFRLVEMDVAGSLEISGPTNMDKIKKTAGKLINQVVDGDLAERLHRTWEGNAWILRGESINQTSSTEGKFILFYFLKNKTYFIFRK